MSFHVHVVNENLTFMSCQVHSGGSHGESMGKT